MACTPFPALTVGRFEISTQGVWNNADETKGNRSCAYASGTLTVTGPNGSTSFNPLLSGFVRHKFFGTGNYLAVLTTDGVQASPPGPCRSSTSRPQERDVAGPAGSPDNGHRRLGEASSLGRVRSLTVEGPLHE